MCVGKFCNRNVVCAMRDTTIVEAAHLMRHNHVGDVIVVNEMDGGRQPIGIVTDRDLVVEVISAGLDPNLVKVGDLLLQPLVTVEEGAGYAETIRLMTAKGVRRMPVAMALTYINARRPFVVFNGCVGGRTGACVPWEYPPNSDR
jgi:CBS domain-containing protein